MERILHRAVRGQAFAYPVRRSITYAAGYSTRTREEWCIGFAASVDAQGAITAWRGGLHPELKGGKPTGRLGSLFKGRPYDVKLIDPVQFPPDVLRARLLARSSAEFDSIDELRAFVRGDPSPL